MRRVAFAALGVMLAAWLAAGALAAKRRSEPLPVYGQVPAFALTDQRGQGYSLDAVRGQIWVADFVFTRCAGQCPMMHAAMAKLAHELRGRPVRLVSFTVDPDWDTPAVLAQAAQRLGADGQRWRFVTGDRVSMERLCRDGFKLALAQDPAAPVEPITHSTRLVLIDRDGAIRGYYDAADGEQWQRLRRDVQRLLAAS